MKSRAPRSLALFALSVARAGPALGQGGAARARPAATVSEVEIAEALN